MRVCLLERGQLNGYSSSAAVGGLNYLSDDLASTSLIEFTARCADEFDNFVTELSNRTGKRIDYFKDDLLQVALSENEMNALDDSLNHLAIGGQFSSRIQRLSQTELLEFAPFLCEDVVGGYRLAEPQVEVPDLLAALSLATRNHNRIAVREGFTVESIGEDKGVVTVHGRLNGVETSVCADSVVVAAGVLTPGILGLGDMIKMRPVKGQAFRLAGAKPLEEFQGRPFQFHVYSHPDDDGDVDGRVFGSYIVPRRNGEVVAGVTYEEDSGFDTSINESAERKMIAINERVVPMLSSMEVLNSWSGLRPMMAKCGERKPDELCLPIVGRLSEASSILLATGHLGLGITMSDGTAKLLEKVLFDELDPFDRSALSVMHPRLFGETAEVA